jgi:hypothetical protein
MLRNLKSISTHAFDIASGVIAGLSIGIIFLLMFSWTPAPAYIGTVWTLVISEAVSALAAVLCCRHGIRQTKKHRQTLSAFPDFRSRDYEE